MENMYNTSGMGHGVRSQTFDIFNAAKLNEHNNVSVHSAALANAIRKYHEHSPDLDFIEIVFDTYFDHFAECKGQG